MFIQIRVFFLVLALVSINNNEHSSVSGGFNLTLFTIVAIKSFL